MTLLTQVFEYLAHLCNFRLQLLVREDLLQILRQLLLDDSKVEWLVALHNYVHDLALKYRTVNCILFK